jgi:hypothetical protein
VNIIRIILLITGPLALALVCGFSTLLHSTGTAPTPPGYGAMLRACALKTYQFEHLPPVNEKRPWLNPARAAISA